MKPEEMPEEVQTYLRSMIARMRVSAQMTAGARTLDEYAEEIEALITPKPRTVRLPAAELPAPLEEVPESGEVFVLCAWAPDGLTCLRGYAKAAKIAVNEGMAYATQADAEAWLAHLQSWRNPRPGDDWTPHTPGDPMPCDGGAMVEVQFRDGNTGTDDASAREWGRIKFPNAEITAWRYAREGEG